VILLGKIFPSLHRLEGISKAAEKISAYLPKLNYKCQPFLCRCKLFSEDLASIMPIQGRNNGGATMATRQPSYRHNNIASLVPFLKILA
jgi:hypothetical protein